MLILCACKLSLIWWNLNNQLIFETTQRHCFSGFRPMPLNNNLVVYAVKELKQLILRSKLKNNAITWGLTEWFWSIKVWEALQGRDDTARNRTELYRT